MDVTTSYSISNYTDQVFNKDESNKLLIGAQTGNEVGGYPVPGGRLLVFT